MEDEGLTSASLAAYSPPPWALSHPPSWTTAGAKRKHVRVLVCLDSPIMGNFDEDGDEDGMVESIDVGSAARYVIGQRAGRADIDIDIQHPSVAPRHAVLQYAAHDAKVDESDGDFRPIRRDGSIVVEGARTSVDHDPLGVKREDGGKDGGKGERKEPRLYVYDMGSAHGTYVNDARLPPRTYRRLRWGDVLRFGECPRPYTLVRRRCIMDRSMMANLDRASSTRAEGQLRGNTATKKRKGKDEGRKGENHHVEAEREEDHDEDNDQADEGDGRMCDHLNQDEDVDGETPHLLCIDVGTTGLRAYAYDVSPRGSEASSRAGCRNRGGCYRRLPTLYPQPGWVEQDPNVVWETLKEVITKVLQKTRISASQVKAIGMTTQRASFLLWNKETGEPLCNFITWQDVRTANICEEWNKSLSFKGIHAFSMVAHMVTRKTRHLMGSIFKFATIHCTPRLIWALKNVEGAQKLAEQGKLLFGTTDTWLLWKLTGGKVHATDYSNASATGLYDTFELEWNQQLFGVVGLPANIFPEVRSTSGDFGNTLPELFGAAIPIKAIVADQQAALFGECCFDVGESKVTIGTGCFIDINTGSQPLVSTHGLSPLIAWAIDDEVTYMIEGTMPSVGSVIDWGSREMGWYRHAKETEGIATSVSDTRGVYFVPAFSGLSAPQQDPTARGTILGMTTSTKKEHLVRAMLESIGYTCNDLLETVKVDLPSLRMAPLIKIDGGVSQNNFVNQFIADMTGRDIIKHPHSDQITALGAAFLAGLGAGVWKSKSELKSLRASLHRFTPQLDEETRKTKYAAWKRAVERAMNWAQDGSPLASQASGSPALQKRTN